MKVVSVEVYDVETVAPAWHPVIVRVNTDEGISGLGEVGLAYGTGRGHWHYCHLRLGLLLWRPPLSGSAAVAAEPGSGEPG